MRSRSAQACSRCYTSRVENGHTVPSVETLEKYARALEIPIYRLFYEGEEPAKALKVSKRPDSNEWGATGKEHEELRRFAKLLASFLKFCVLRNYPDRKADDLVFVPAIHRIITSSVSVLSAPTRACR